MCSEPSNISHDIVWLYLLAYTENEMQTFGVDRKGPMSQPDNAGIDDTVVVSEINCPWVLMVLMS